MHPDWESEVEPEQRDQKAANAERDALRRAQMVDRTRERRGYWQKELAAERFEEFRPEMRRRVQVEQTLLDGLEKTDTPTYILLRDYQAEAVHRAPNAKPAVKQSFNEWLASRGVTDPAIVDDPFIRPRMVKIRETMQRLETWKDRNDLAGIHRETDLLRRQLEAVNQYATDHRRCLTFQD
jgi:hypothetical protein